VKRSFLGIAYEAMLKTGANSSDVEVR